MDAHALLSSQGWRGTGHSLHKTDDAIGLAKPLLISRKDNTKGLGQKQHFTSDQWWMNAFDEQLKGLDTSKEGKVVQTVTKGKLGSFDKNLGKYSIYSTFVRGGFLEGTISSLKKDDSSSTESSDEEVAKKNDPAPESKPRKETKEERRARKDAKRRRKEERALRRAAKQEHKKKSKSSSTESSDADEAKREEKRRRRERKEKKRREKQQKKDS